jgi:hypothetical protein
MAEMSANPIGNQAAPTFKANLRLWSDTVPLAPVVQASLCQWDRLYIKGQTIPARGKASPHIATRHYATSEDREYADIRDIGPVIEQWLDEIESGRPPIASLAQQGRIEAVLWVAIFGGDEVATPVLSEEIDKRAKSAGVQILLENYTIEEPEDGNSDKTFLGAIQSRR